MPDERAADQIPPGFKLRHTLRGHKANINRIAWSPDGRMLASTSLDRSVKVWDAQTGALLRVLGPGLTVFWDVTWSPDWCTLEAASSQGVTRWDVDTWVETRTSSHYIGTVYAIAWSPDGSKIAAGSQDGAITLWHTSPLRLFKRLTDSPFQILTLAWSPDGKQLFSTSGALLSCWDTSTWELESRVPRHRKSIYALAWSPDGQQLVTGSDDATIRVSTLTRELTTEFLPQPIPDFVLEGHMDKISWVGFSPDGRLLASKSMDNTVRLWRCDTWANVAILPESAGEPRRQGLAFHPTDPTLLATLGEEDTVIRIWELDVGLLLGAGAGGVSYTNAKVVLVGETGVGKTGLGLRLAEGKWQATESTHGMNVWPLHSEPEREVMLWDFAGQDEYKLVHQLFLNETNVALLLYDPTKSQDTFEGIEFWEKALRNVIAGDVQKFLVAARVDVGGVRLTAEDIDAYCRAHGFVSHLATSAQTGEGCDDLRAAILAAIPWDKLPRTSSPEVFKRIKDFLADVRQGNRLLVRETDLRAEFDRETEAGARPTEAEFRTVIGHVETAGLIKRLSFGDFLLLKPELLNAYAASIVDAARRHTHGLGAVRKADVLEGRVRLKDEGGLQVADKVFLLHATVELSLRLGLALEQDGNLVFPSKFNRRMPPLREDPVIEVEFAFEGPVENLYTTLVVKLYYGGVFKLKQLWKNAAEFLDGHGRVCGFQLQHEGEGRGTLKVFNAEGVSDNDKALFLKIVADHFKEKGIEVERQRIYRCPRPECREVVRDPAAVRRAVERQKEQIFCQDCGGPIPLIDALETLYRDDRKFRSQLIEMETRAEASMEQGGELVSASAELRTENFKTWAGGTDIANVAIVFTDVLDSTRLNVKFRDEGWQHVRKAHFARAEELVRRGQGYLIKNKGDGVMAAFRDASAALDFALALYRDTGHEQVHIRVGIHIGPVEVSAEDAFGQQVNMAARVEAKAQDGGIWVSAKVKEDIDTLGAARHKNLKWDEHAGQELKGFPGQFTLWSVREA
ncbi:MAG TPA: adenylate/guanylate cyclase domain-containing protein [Pyrinomonadaceae bacterium]|jgi:WD40 repeat protein/class 3 adenylate cyclase/GTPase SAR1 family protein